MRLDRRAQTAAAAAALSLLALAGCKQGGETAQGSAAIPALIKIGATLPLTGSEARAGGFYKEGYDLAFDEVSKAGGLTLGGKKVPVALTLLDDTSTQATAANLADRLINSDKVDFLLGTYASHLVKAQSVVAEQNGVPYVQGGGAALEIFSRGFKNVFGLLAPVNLLADAQMRWLELQQKAGKLPKPSKIALVWENTDHGKDFRRGVNEFAARPILVDCTAPPATHLGAFVPRRGCPVGATSG